MEFGSGPEENLRVAQASKAHQVPQVPQVGR
jgi:hypothetical protein